MPHRLIQLRYPAKCSSCGAALSARADAWWDSAAKTARCTSCGDAPGEGSPAAAAPADETPVASIRGPAPEPKAPAPNGPKLIRVRYDGACAGCSVPLPARAQAWWDRATKTMWCQVCGPGAVPAAGPAAAEEAAPVEPVAVEAPSPPPTLSPSPPARRASVAGGSAQREYERLTAKREARVRSRHPRLGGLILALSEDPQTTVAWAKGAEGERKLGAGLDSLAVAGVVALHDRLIPGTRANIDHLAVCPSGVWVIDAKRYKGQVTKKDVGGWFRTDVRLYVGRRDCTKLVPAMAKQVAAVRKALGVEWSEVPVRPALCFVDAEWGWFAKPFELGGVLVAWPKAMRQQLVRPGPYSPEGIEAVAAVLEERLKPAS